MERMIQSMRELAKENPFLQSEMRFAIKKLKKYQSKGMGVKRALMLIPQGCPSFLEWIGIIDVELPDDFMIKYESQVDWTIVSASIFRPLKETFIRKYATHLDWRAISWYQHPSETLMREYSDRLYWDSISYGQQLSESFMRDFAEHMYWQYISERQTLSESFIRDFIDRISWDKISNHQRLSLEFIREFRGNLTMCQNLQDSIKRGHAKLALLLNDNAPNEVASIVISFM